MSESIVKTWTEADYPPFVQSELRKLRESLAKCKSSEEFQIIQSQIESVIWLTDSFLMRGWKNNG